MPSTTATSRPAASAPVAGADPVRERIVGTAREHFFRHGFARFTMDDLAAELGMSKKTLYRHFHRKHDLVDELISRKSTAMVAGLEEILAEPDLTFAERGARFHRQALTQLGEISVAFLRDLRRFTPDLYARIEAVRALNVPRLWERLLQAGIAAGAVRPDIDAPFAARTVLLGIQSLLLPENLERFDAPPHEVVARFLNLIFAGLLTTKGRNDYEKNRASFERPLPVR